MSEDRLGPYLIDALPDELAGYDEALFTRLRDLVLRTGTAHPTGPLRLRRWSGKLCVSASAVPGQLRLMITDGSGMAVGDVISMIFMDSDGDKYVMLDRRIPAATIRDILDAESPQN